VHNIVTLKPLFAAFLPRCNSECNLHYGNVVCQRKSLEVLYEVKVKERLTWRQHPYVRPSLCDLVLLSKPLSEHHAIRYRSSFQTAVCRNWVSWKPRL